MSRKLWGIAAVLVVGVIIGIFIMGSRPSTGTITHYQPAKRTDMQRPQTLELKGDYFRMTYKGIYGSDDTSKVDPKAFEQHRLKASATYEKILAVTIVPLQGSLAEESSYNLRTHHPEDYRHSVSSGPAGQADIMDRVDGTERVIYFTRSGKLAILAMTSNGPSDDLKSEGDDLIKSFAWTK